MSLRDVFIGIISVFFVAFMVCALTAQIFPAIAFGFAAAGSNFLYEEVLT